MFEKLNRPSCLVKFCWFRIIAQAGRVELTAAKSEDIKSITLVCRLVHFNTFFQEVLMVTVLEHLTAKARKLIGRVKFDLKQSQSVAYSKLLILLYIKKKTECDFENLIVVINCKIYLEKRLHRILLHILLFSLELPRRGRPLTKIELRKTLLFFSLLLSFLGLRGEEMVNPQIKTWKSFFSFDFPIFVLES